MCVESEDIFVEASSTFMWVSGIELSLPGLYDNSRYPLTHLSISPAVFYFFVSVLCGSGCCKH